jgi:hypothetical protein
MRLPSVRLPASNWRYRAAAWPKRCRGCKRATAKAQRGDPHVPRQTYGNKESFSNSVVFRRPDAFRLDFFFAAINQLGSITTIKGGQLQSIDLQASKVLRGPANIETVEATLGVPFEPDELMLWLVAGFSPQLGSALTPAEIVSTPDLRQIAVTYPTKYRRSMTLYLERWNGCYLLRGLELRFSDDDAPRLVTRYRYSPSIVCGDTIVPDGIEFWLPEEEMEGQLGFDSTKVNPDLSTAPQALFSPAIPDGFEVEVAGEEEQNQ